MGTRGRRFVLALGDDADRVEHAEGTAVIERLPLVVLVETDVETAQELTQDGEYVHVYNSPHDALLVLELFRPPE